MAFKLKSPFNVTEVKPTLGKGGVVGKGSSAGAKVGIQNHQVDLDSNTAGEQGIEEETTGNEQTKKLTEKAEKGIPVDLNPKQQAKLATREYKKGIRDKKRTDRQTEKAQKIYARNQFEELQNLDEKGHIIPEGKEGAGTTWFNPDAADKEKTTRSIAAADRVWQATEDLNKASEDARLQEKKIKNKIAGKDVENWGKTEEKDPAPKMLNTKENIRTMLMGKPNRAGTPVRMLRSTEDTTPMKYKSVKEAGRENLMSALAKQGEPIDYKKFESRIKSNPGFATSGTEFKATEPGTSNQPDRVTVGDRAKESVKKAVKLGFVGGGLKL